MSVEIERKFLLTSDDWRVSILKSERLRDGLVAFSDSHKVRVRSYGDRSTLTIKTIGLSLRRQEFEYEIPNEDAEELLNNHCGIYRLDKTRHHVPYEGETWLIDEYEGILRGVIIAEIELDHEGAEFPLPPWTGAEITLNPHYKKINMLRRALDLSDIVPAR